jgi:hypothetical protein
MVMVRVMTNFRVSVKDEVRIVGFSVKVPVGFKCHKKYF